MTLDNPGAMFLGGALVGYLLGLVTVVIGAVVYRLAVQKATSPGVGTISQSVSSPKTTALDNAPVMLTIKRTAEILGLSESRVREMIKSGALPAKKFGGGETRTRYVVLSEDVRSFMATVTDTKP